MREVGTLDELDVKPGDVVECVRWIGDFYSKGRHYQVVDGLGVVGKSIGTMDIHGDWRIISRASDKPKLWRDMTPEEKGALLLAAHEGKKFEYYCSFSKDWLDVGIYGPNWYGEYAYRIRPEPKVETMTIHSSDMSFGHLIAAMKNHRITFNTINGKPDCASIKMEAL